MIVPMNESVQVATKYDGRLFKVQALAYTDDSGRSVQREVVRHPGAVLIVPVLDDQHVVMIRNYRIAVDECLWEFPAGKLESNEPPISAAHRELEEETGYRAAQVHKLGEFYTSPGFTDERMHVFVAENLTVVGQRLEPGEEIEVRTVPVSEAIEMVRDGTLRDAKSIAGLLMWLDARRRNEP
jgi:ADP-ribose pyrophosphatase